MCISLWTTTEPTKPLSSGNGSPNARAFTSTSRPPAVPGPTWWNDGSRNSPTSEFDVACSAASNNWRRPSASTSTCTRKILSPSFGPKRRTKSWPASLVTRSARPPRKSITYDTNHWDRRLVFLSYVVPQIFVSLGGCFYHAKVRASLFGEDLEHPGQPRDQARGSDHDVLCLTAKDALGAGHRLQPIG